MEKETPNFSLLAWFFVSYFPFMVYRVQWVFLVAGCFQKTH
jgi:hypothetical protein